PVAGQIHDFREFNKQALTPQQAANLKWAEVDSDWSYTALLRVGDPARPLDEAVSVTFRHSGLRFGRYGDYYAIYGEKGTLHVAGKRGLARAIGTRCASSRAHRLVTLSSILYLLFSILGSEQNYSGPRSRRRAHHSARRAFSCCGHIRAANCGNRRSGNR